jgi:hypothetical protein
MKCKSCQALNLRFKKLSVVFDNFSANIWGIDREQSIYLHDRTMLQRRLSEWVSQLEQVNGGSPG